MDYYELKARLEKVPLDKDLLRSDLLNLGLKNSTTINNATNYGLLQKTRRGVYRVSLPYEEQINQDLKKKKNEAWNEKYTEFYKEIMAGKFGVAYKHLIWLLQNRINNNFDNNLRLYMLLLENVLKLDSLALEFDFVLESDSNIILKASYYSHYINFQKSFVMGELDKANESLMLFSTFEKTAKKGNSQNTLIVKKIFESILERREEIKPRVSFDDTIDIISLNYDNLMTAIDEVNINCTNEGLLKLDKLLEERIAIFYHSKKMEVVIFDILARDLISFLRQVQGDYSEYNKGQLKFVSYVQTEYDGADIIEKFIEALKGRDYLSAYSMVNDENWRSLARKHSKSKYLFLFKRLLLKIHGFFDKKTTKFNKGLDSVDDSSGILNWLKEELEKDTCDYLGISDKWDEMVSTYLIDQDFARDVNTFLEMACYYQECELVEVYKKYKEALKNCDFNLARSYLTQYEMLTKVTANERNYKYLYQILEDDEDDFKKGIIVKRRYIYLRGITFFKEKNFDMCIKEMINYISLNPEHSSRGYLLLGEAYEWKRDISKAFEYYEKVIEDGDLPGAYLRIGKIYFRNGDYQQALQYYLEFEARKPLNYRKSLENLIAVYEKQGDCELKNKYSRRLERANNIQRRMSDEITSKG